MREYPGTEYSKKSATSSKKIVVSAHFPDCRPSIKERRKAAVLSGIEMFRQLLGNECALLSFFQCECQQNSPDDAEAKFQKKTQQYQIHPAPARPRTRQGRSVEQSR